jgi:hypothetical protein
MHVLFSPLIIVDCVRQYLILSFPAGRIKKGTLSYPRETIFNYSKQRCVKGSMVHKIIHGHFPSDSCERVWGGCGFSLTKG